MSYNKNIGKHQEKYIVEKILKKDNKYKNILYEYGEFRNDENLNRFRTV